MVTKLGVPKGVANVGASPQGLLWHDECQSVELVLELYYRDSKDKLSLDSIKILPSIQIIFNY